MPGGYFIDPLFSGGGDTQDMTDEQLAALFGFGEDVADEPDDPVFDPTQQNPDYWEQFEFDPTAGYDQLYKQLLSELVIQGQALGWTKPEFTSFLQTWELEMRNYANAQVYYDQQRRENQWGLYSRISGGRDEGQPPSAHEYFFGTQEGFVELTQRTWDFLRTKDSQLQAYGAVKAPKPPGGGGRRRLTAKEIRQQFDLDELAMAATNIWRRKLLEEPSNARDMASAYIEAVVATRGEQKIDFQTFIENRARDTARWASVYRSKPENVSEEEYLLPYHQAALQVTRPENAAGVAIGGAQFGASAETFGSRLRRTKEATSSAPFINQLQGRLENLGQVLRG